MAAINSRIRGVRTLYDIVRRFALLMLTAALLPSAAVCAQSPRRAECDARSSGPRLEQARLVHSSALPSSTPAAKRDVAIRAATDPCGDVRAQSMGTPNVAIDDRVDVLHRVAFARAIDDAAPSHGAKCGPSPEPGDHPRRLPAAP